MMGPCMHPLDHLSAIYQQLSFRFGESLHVEAASGRFQQAGIHPIHMNEFLDRLFVDIQNQLTLHFQTLAPDATARPAS